MNDCKNQSDFSSVRVAVVEIRNGESKEEAWCRYLAEHPESVEIRIKIFNYPNPNSNPGKS